MKTTLYLVRQAAAEATPAGPARLERRRCDPPLGRLGVRQAELTRDFLAVRPIDACFSSPAARAVQTARIIAEPHGLSPGLLEALAEWDGGDGDGIDGPRPAGESFARVQGRVTE